MTVASEQQLAGPFVLTDSSDLQDLVTVVR